MAKIALVLVFSLAMILSMHCAVGDDALFPAQSPSGFKEAAQSPSSSTGPAMESATQSSSSWTDWAKDKLRGYGLMSPAESTSSSAWAPEGAPAQSPATLHVRSFGPKHAAAPIN